MHVHLPEVATWMQKEAQTKPPPPPKNPLKLSSLVCFLCVDTPHIGLGSNIPHILKFPLRWAALSGTILNAGNSTAYVLQIIAAQKNVLRHP